MSYCASGHTCATTASCNDASLECTWSAATTPDGQIGWCLPVSGGATPCGNRAIVIVDANGNAYCSDFSYCTVGSSSCAVGTCLAGTALRLPTARVAHGEGICASAR